jgi:hypothetical protein
LKNITGRRADISWVITEQMLHRQGYLDEYLAFWTAQPEIEQIWLSLYTPQQGERSAERLTPESRQSLLKQLPKLKQKYPARLLPGGAIGVGVCAGGQSSSTRSAFGGGLPFSLSFSKELRDPKRRRQTFRVTVPVATVVFHSRET